MTQKQATWQMPAITAILLVGASLAHAQPTQKNPASIIPANSSASANILPVSLTNDHVAATVNGEKILVGELKKILDARPYPLTLSAEQKKQLRQSALDVLVDDVVMRQYLTKQVPQVSQAEFDKEVQDLKTALEKQKLTLDKWLLDTDQSQDQLRRDIIAQLQWKSYLKRVYPDEKLKPYYDANKPHFDKVLVRASHILIKLPPNPPKDKRDHAMQQMLVWRQEILAGKTTFEEIAKKYSECPSKDKGGDIGQFTYLFAVVPEFAKTAFSLKVGEVGEVVQTVFGLHLIKVTDRTAAEPSTFEGMKETVRAVWAQDEELYQRVLSEHRKVCDVKILLP